MKLFLTKLLLVISIINIVSFENNFYADDVLYTEGDLQYNLVDDAIILVKYIGDDSNVTLPYNLGVYEIKGIKTGAFKDTSVTSLKIHNNISYYDESDLISSNISYSFIDIEGNDVEAPISVKESDTVLNVTDKKVTPKVDNVTSTEFEEEEVDISEELDKEPEPQNIIIDQKTEEEQKKLRNRFFQLFDASGFVSSFKANPVGYIIILLSLSALVLVFRRYINNR